MLHWTSAPIEATAQEKALAAFCARKAEIDGMLARLEAPSDDHFGIGPDEVFGGLVASLTSKGLATTNGESVGLYGNSDAVVEEHAGRQEVDLEAPLLAMPQSSLRARSDRPIGVLREVSEPHLQFGPLHLERLSRRLASDPDHRIE